MSSSPVAVTKTSDFAPVSSKEFLDIQATIECGFTLKRIRDMTRRYSYNDKLGNELAEENFETVYVVCYLKLTSLDSTFL